MSIEAAARKMVALFEEFELPVERELIQPAVHSFAERVAKESSPGVVTFNLCAAADQPKVFLLIVFRDSSAFEEHLSFLKQAGGFPHPMNSLKITKIWISGQLTEAMQKTVEESGIPYEWAAVPLGGFARFDRSVE